MVSIEVQVQAPPMPPRRGLPRQGTPKLRHSKPLTTHLQAITFRDKPHLNEMTKPRVSTLQPLREVGKAHRIQGVVLSERLLQQLRLLL